MRLSFPDQNISGKSAWRFCARTMPEQTHRAFSHFIERREYSEVDGMKRPHGEKVPPPRKKKDDFSVRPLSLRQTCRRIVRSIENDPARLPFKHPDQQRGNLRGGSGGHEAAIANVGNAVAA